MIYLICFFFSVLFAHLAYRTNKIGYFIFYSIISILVTTMLAGLRDYSVGIDTLNYYYGIWDWATTAESIPDFFEKYSLYSDEKNEWLFATLVGLVAQIGDYHLLLFFVHLIIIGGVYIGAFRMRHHARPEIILLLFYLLYYNHSLNIYRQYMAMAIVFAAVADVEKRKYLRYLIFVVIAAFFHRTAIIGVGPLILYVCLYPKKDKITVSNFQKIILLVALIIFMSYLVVGIQFLLDAGLINEDYEFFLDSSEASNYTMVLLFLLVELMALGLTWQNFKKNTLLPDYFIFCTIAFFLLFLVGGDIIYGKRIAAYFSLLNIVTLGKMIHCQPTKENKTFYIVGIIVTVFVYWCYVFAYRNASQTMPYILGI